LELELTLICHFVWDSTFAANPGTERFIQRNKPVFISVAAMLYWLLFVGCILFALFWVVRLGMSAFSVRTTPERQQADKKK
jgi:hypothetical protein